VRYTDCRDACGFKALRPAVRVCVAPRADEVAKRSHDLNVAVCPFGPSSALTPEHFSNLSDFFWVADDNAVSCKHSYNHLHWDGSLGTLLRRSEVESSLRKSMAPNSGSVSPDDGLGRWAHKLGHQLAEESPEVCKTR